MSRVFTSAPFLSLLFLIPTSLRASKAQAELNCDLFSLDPKIMVTKEAMKNTESLLKVAMDGTHNYGEIAEGMLPRGSALITSSGELAKSGIAAIIHAAPGSMTKAGGHYEPNLDSIKTAIANSVRLAEFNGHKRIAIPLVGGGIFLQRLGIDRQQLAKEIIDAAVSARQKNTELRFVGFDSDAVVFQSIVTNLSGTPGLGVDAGSITDGRVHGASAIVNAANTEVIFGGGLSGAIGKATGNPDGINQEARRIIEELSNN